MKKTLATICLLLQLAAASLLLAQNNASDASGPTTGNAAPPANFVGVSNGNFSLNGRRYRHVGVNTIALLYHSQDEAWNDFWFLQQAGVKQVRVFLPNNLFTLQEMKDRLRWTLNVALAHDIRLTVVFTDFYFKTNYATEGGKWINNKWVRGHFCVPGDEGFYNEAGVLKREWVVWGYTKNYRPFVQAIVDEFRDHEGIFSWQIGNEIKDSEILNDDAIVNFYTTMADFIKSRDANHLVSTGMMSTRHLGLDETRKSRLYGRQSIDYVTEHYYDPGDPDDLGDEYLAIRYNKPLVIEEYGVKLRTTECPDGYDRSVIMQRVRQFFSDLYNDPDKPADSVMIWGVEFRFGHGSGDACVGPLQQNLVDEYMALWQEWSTRLSSEGGPPPAPTNLAASPNCNSIYFSWNASNGATGYWLDIAQTQSDLDNMTGTFRNYHVGSATNYTWTGLAPVTNYYWRVYAYNSYGGVHAYPTPRYVTTWRYCDVPPDHTFYYYIECLSRRGIVTGYADGNFLPGNPVTRGQFVKMTVLAMGFPLLNPQQPTFSDVPPGSAFYQHVETAVTRGIISGYTDGTFRPYNNITRGQMAKVIVIAGQQRWGWQINTSGGPHFPNDVPPGSVFYDYVETAYNLGLMSGYGGGYFYPYNDATRGQGAKVVSLGSYCNF